MPGAGDVASAAGVAGLIDKVGGRAAIAGTIAGGEPADEGVDTLAGVAIVGGEFFTGVSDAVSVVSDTGSGRSWEQPTCGSLTHRPEGRKGAYAIAMA